VIGTSQFARFLTAGITDVVHIRDHHVGSFIGTLPVCWRKNGYSMPGGRGSRAARSVLRYLRAIGIVTPEPLAEVVFRLDELRMDSKYLVKRDKTRCCRPPKRVRCSTQYKVVL